MRTCLRQVGCRYKKPKSESSKIETARALDESQRYMFKINGWCGQGRSNSCAPTKSKNYFCLAMIMSLILLYVA